MLTLQEYDLAALKVLSNWRKRKGKLEASEELLGRMVRFMCMADWKYQEGKSKLTQYDYRQMHAIYAIREYVKEKKLRRTYEDVNTYVFWNEPAQYDEKIGRKLKFIIKNSGLNKEEKQVIDSTLYGLDISQTAERMGINYERCKNIYNSSINKMQRIINNVE